MNPETFERSGQMSMIRFPNRSMCVVPHPTGTIWAGLPAAVAIEALRLWLGK